MRYASTARARAAMLSDFVEARSPRRSRAYRQPRSSHPAYPFAAQSKTYSRVLTLRKRIADPLHATGLWYAPATDPPAGLHHWIGTSPLMANPEQVPPRVHASHGMRIAPSQRERSFPMHARV